MPEDEEVLEETEEQRQQKKIEYMCKVCSTIYKKPGMCTNCDIILKKKAQ